MKKILKTILLLSCILTLPALSGCEKKQPPDPGTAASVTKTDAVVEADAALETKFVKYTRSLPVGDGYLRLPFYCSEGDIANWDKWNITSMYIQIGENRTELQYMQGTISVETMPMYDRYYSGELILYGTFEKACFGTMYLIVKMRDEERERKYNVGQCSIVEGSKKEKQAVSCIEAGAVANTDENNDMCTYGNIVHLKVKEDITIHSIDLGLPDVSLDTGNCIIYSDKEYKAVSKGICGELATDNYETYYLEINRPWGMSEEQRRTASWNKLWPDCYKKNVGEAPGTDLHLKLKKGEYYIYFPFIFKDKDSLSVVGSVLQCTYSCNSSHNLHYVSKSNPYFLEYRKDQAYLDKLFQGTE